MRSQQHLLLQKQQVEQEEKHAHSVHRPLHRTIAQIDATFSYLSGGSSLGKDSVSLLSHRMTVPTAASTAATSTDGPSETMDWLAASKTRQELSRQRRQALLQAPRQRRKDPVTLQWTQHWDEQSDSDTESNLSDPDLVSYCNWAKHLKRAVQAGDQPTSIETLDARMNQDVRVLVHLSHEQRKALRVMKTEEKKAMRVNSTASLGSANGTHWTPVQMAQREAVLRQLSSTTTQTTSRNHRRTRTAEQDAGLAYRMYRLLRFYQ